MGITVQIFPCGGFSGKRMDNHCISGLFLPLSSVFFITSKRYPIEWAGFFDFYGFWVMTYDPSGRSRTY